MISGLVHAARPGAPDTLDALADTLACLIAGVAAGVIGDAVIVTSAASAALEALADGSGATLALTGDHTGPDSPWSVGARHARRDWLLCLEAGDVLREGWVRTLDRFTGTARPEVALGRLRRTHAGWADRLAGRGEAVFGARRPRAGDLVRREHLRAGPILAPRLRPYRIAAVVERA